MADCATSVVLSAETEGSLISRVYLREQGALAEIYDRFASTVYSIALRVLREPLAAETVMQEVFLELWRNPDAYGSHGPLRACLALAGRKRAIDTLRQRKPDEDSTAYVVPISRFNFADSAEQEVTLHEVRRTIESLPVIQRQIFELAFYKGLTLLEIAASTGEPIGIVKTCICNTMLSIRNVTSSSARRQDAADCKPPLDLEVVLP